MEAPRGRRIDNPAWDARTILLAAYIHRGASVIEFGCGRQVLRDHLPAECTYQPSDIESRSEDTLVLDLNSPSLPTLPHFDVAFFGGVLEYIEDVPRLIRTLSPSMDAIVCSYASRDVNRGNREVLGWVNSYDTSGLLRIFYEADYLVSAMGRWQSQLLFRFDHRREFLRMPPP